MKRILIIAALVVASTVASYSQGLVSISLTGGSLISTNGPTATGKITGASTFYFELLISSNLGLVGSTANDIMNHSSLLANWLDSGVTGYNGTGIAGGKITAPGSAAATGWALPGVAYDNPMAYMVVGWSSNFGNNWSAVSTLLSGSGLGGVGYFGTTVVAENYAGGGPSSLLSVNMWGNATGTTGFGISTAPYFSFNPVPEPSTIALAGLGALSLLLFRRRQ